MTTTNRVEMDYINRTLKEEVQSYNKECGILSLGILGSYCPNKENVPEFIVDTKNMKIDNYNLIDDGEGLKLGLSISYDAVYRKWEDKNYKETYKRNMDIVLDNVATDAQRHHPTPIKDFLRGERVDRTLSDTLHRLIRTEEKKLHNELISK